MKKEFKFKPTQSNIEKLYAYAKHKFPKLKNKLDYDSWGQFVFYKKNEDTTIFYYVNNKGNLNYNVYKKCVAKIDKVIIRDFKHRVFKDEKLKSIFDKLLVPLSR